MTEMERELDEELRLQKQDSPQKSRNDKRHKKTLFPYSSSFCVFCTFVFLW
jgi:hypothetical protein